MGTPPFPNVATDAVRTEFEFALPDAGRVRDVALLGKSFGHQSFVVTVDSGGRFVVKIARIPAEVTRLQRTAEFARRALAGGVATPNVFRVGPACRNFGGRPYLVQEFLPGLDAEEAWPGLTAPEREKFLVEFGAAAAALHAIGAPHFDEGMVIERERSSWSANVLSRLARSRKDNEKAGVLSPREISATVERLAHLLETVGNEVTPALVHRDLHLRNALVHGGVFSALLDFEHARFSDPMMEFVALQTLLFERQPGSAAAFHTGYWRHRPAPVPRQEERFAICRGLELFGRIPYLHRNRQAEELASTVAKLRSFFP